MLPPLAGETVCELTRSPSAAGQPLLAGSDHGVPAEQPDRQCHTSVLRQVTVLSSILISMQIFKHNRFNSEELPRNSNQQLRSDPNIQRFISLENV